MAQKLGSASHGGGEPGNQTETEKPAIRSSDLEGLLSNGDKAIANGAAQEALTSIQRSLNQLNVNNLPKALLLMGKGRWRWPRLPRQPRPGNTALRRC